MLLQLIILLPFVFTYILTLSILWNVVNVLKILRWLFSSSYVFYVLAAKPGEVARFMQLQTKAPRTSQTICGNLLASDAFSFFFTNASWEFYLSFEYHVNSRGVTANYISNKIVSLKNQGSRSFKKKMITFGITWKEIWICKTNLEGIIISFIRTVILGFSFEFHSSSTR